MASAAVAILDALRKKPVADKKKHFSVAFFVAPAKQHVQKERQEQQEQDQERQEQGQHVQKEREQEQERESIEKQKKPMVQITDKTSLKLVNREDIFARIKAARGIITQAAPNPLNLRRYA